MRGVLLPGDRQCRLADFADPEPGPGEVVVAMRAAAVCGSDLHGYRATASERGRQAEIIPGHEPAGVVAAIGPEVRGARVGDRVSVYHYRGCGTCSACRSGALMWCPNRRGYGGPIHGSDADLLLTDERNCLPLPGDFSFETGALIACNTGTAYSALRKLDPSGRDTLAIFGLGPVGLNGLVVGKALGARIIGVDVSPERRRLADELGADLILDPTEAGFVEAIRAATEGDGADLAFETSGNPRAQADVVEVLHNGGKGVFVGFGAAEPAINPSRFIGKQLTLMGSFVAPIDAYEDLVRFIRRHHLPLDRLVTHRFPLADAPEAFALADRARTGKVMFVWE